ncbi:hypothetical protein PILCRDRAFT_820215 [Piloderma croceum F 1598]|uniref:Vesicle tethering protein Uso1/P115-like head domain-containing protein n=1 Tax=Piloderma croceum (strain F 1598) TaxID=765440 RepID=A0A0C3FCL4_PILCF|nr:hypothetical protein PILCRDRAFT_820215 [Piloderma croceum F 1598]
MEFFNQTYIALRGPTGAPQTAVDTIGRLSDRLSPSTLLADRRAAVLSLKGLSRDCKQDVGDRALPGLIEVLQNDAEIDADIGKAVLETLNTLCDTEDSTPGGKEIGFKHTDYILANEKAIHILFSLLGDANFYIRYATLQFLTTLLQNRRQVIQAYFLKAAVGPASVIAVLDDKREITRNEGIIMVQSLISQSPDIQKILAFEGAFEKLFNTIEQEGGVEGGIVAHDALICVDGLLRFNASNQSYFREISLPPVLCQLLQFAPNLQLHESAPQEFALQFWDDQKASNTSLVVGIMGMLISSKGSNAQESSAFTRCLVEISLASNAPTRLKTQGLGLLPTNLNFPLSEITLTPYMPVPESNGEEWDRLEPASALDALVELVLHGEYNGLHNDKRVKEGLELRGAAVAVFENFIRTEEIRQAIVQAMLPAQDASVAPPVTPLLHALSSPPSAPLSPASVISTHLATLLFSHLLRSSPRAKDLARSIVPPLPASVPEAPGQFFVPADGGPPPEVVSPVEPEKDDDEQPQTLLQLLSENLSLSFLSRSRADTSDRESREWDRLVVGYLCLFSQWLWEDPKAVKEFLEAGGLGVLVEQTNQTSEVDVIVPGLCSFLLGVCYEFNREPGEITRATIRPLLDRLGVDTLVGRMSRLRDDERFKAIGPDSIVLPYPTPANSQIGLRPESGNEGEIWFDWAFVDFWKSNYYTVQRGFETDPDSLSSSSSQNAESAVLVASLRDVIRNQAQQIETLERRLKESSAGSKERTELQSQIANLTARLQSSEEKTKEVEKEQEDLLVLLDEVSSKRRRDKEKMRQAGLEVSEDEADDDDENE